MKNLLNLGLFILLVAGLACAASAAEVTITKNVVTISGVDIALDDPFTVEVSLFDANLGLYVLLSTVTISETTPAQLTLDVGEYQFTEVNLPQGFTPSVNPILLSITDPAAVETVTFTNVVRFGCTLGFWKNHEEAWPAAYDPATSTIAGAGFVYPDLDTTLLMDALKFKGGKGLEGGAKILLRQSVAALFNEAAFGQDYVSIGDLVADVNAALASGDRTAMTTVAEELDVNNNGFCPGVVSGTPGT